MNFFSLQSKAQKWHLARSRIFSKLLLKIPFLLTLYHTSPLSTIRLVKCHIFYRSVFIITHRYQTESFWTSKAECDVFLSSHTQKLFAVFFPSSSSREFPFFDRIVEPASCVCRTQPCSNDYIADIQPSLGTWEFCRDHRLSPRSTDIVVYLPLLQ